MHVLFLIASLRLACNSTEKTSSLPFFSVLWESMFVAVHLSALYFVGAHRLNFAKFGNHTFEFIKWHCLTQVVALAEGCEVMSELSWVSREIAMVKAIFIPIKTLFFLLVLLKSKAKFKKLTSGKTWRLKISQKKTVFLNSAL